MVLFISALRIPYLTSRLKVKMHDQGLLIRKCDAGPLDIFTGRGSFADPGNKRYLLLIAERKEEYRSTKQMRKDLIAREVLRSIVDCAGNAEGDGAMQARFLQLEKGDYKEPHSVWRVMSEDEVMPKIKMSLRQIPYSNREGQASDESSAASTLSLPLISNGKQVMDNQLAGSRDAGIHPSIPREERAKEVPLELQPKLTMEDEKRERASLSVEDIHRIQCDLMGVGRIVQGFSGLGLGSDDNGHTTDNNITASQRPISQQEQKLLTALQFELDKIPSERKVAYALAKLKCPDELSDIKRLGFLEHEEGNALLAAERIIRYWDFRLELFGEDRCYLPMTLTGAMHDEMLGIAGGIGYQLLPNTDAYGRGIIHSCSKNRNLSKFSMKQEFKALFYYLHCMMENDDTRRKGFIQMVDGRHMSRESYSGDWPRYISMLEAALPIVPRAVHICYPSNTLYYIIMPVLSRFIPKHIRLRQNMHHGWTEEVLKSLSKFGLSPDRIHSDLGGDVRIDINQFLFDRMKIEATNLGLEFPSLDPPSQRAGVDDNRLSGKRSRDATLSQPRNKPTCPLREDDDGDSFLDTLANLPTEMLDDLTK